jgi:NAD(P)-dependent dehydrogenase (short-subunit alcohol dehydrogenase family)
MTTVLITGANKGLGRETARRLALLGWTVWLGSRDAAAGEAAAKTIHEDQPDADLRVVPLDVTSDESVHAAYDAVVASGTGLDVLVNNAGVGGRFGSAAETHADDLVGVYAVNVLGPVRVTHTFLPLLRASGQPRLVMVSSGLGSIAYVNQMQIAHSYIPGFAYQSSKAALNMIANQYDRDLPDVRVVAVDPGYTATDLNGFSGTQTVTEGTDAIVAAASEDTVASAHIDRHGAVPW